jgi:CHASE3 domain sensor protein
MRRILNYLLGEELVSEQNDKAIFEVTISVVVMWMAIIVSMLFMQVIR